MSVRLAGTALREIRIHVCQKSPASAGVRAFIENDYVGIKKANPQFPILIREASGIVPRVFARYEHGVERVATLEDLSRENVKSTIAQLASRNKLARTTQ
uniref:NADH dehydrogenase [ubiquinone] 1 alpha subcomplex subunit 2 n=1 Tax=Caenorhabditis tropicalis TaxID=1561998 RepID=A0A1I7T6X8_9PELO